MTAYWMDRGTVGDEEEYAKYRQATAPLGTALQESPLLVMDGRREVLEGPDVFDKLAVSVHPSAARALEFYESPEYQAAARFRRESGSVNELVIADGVEGAALAQLLRPVALGVPIDGDPWPLTPHGPSAGTGTIHPLLGYRKSRRSPMSR